MIRATLLLVLALAGWPTDSGAADDSFAPSPSPPAGQRMTVFISDLHLGVGHVTQDPVTGAWTIGPWHPMEDFRWHAEFDRFLTKIETEFSLAGVPVDLVVVGDFLELWQTPSELGDCIYDVDGKPLAPKDRTAPNAKKVQPDLSCSPADALRRVLRVLAAHADTLSRLRQFAITGDNRVTLVPGNHDAALIFNNVAKATLDAIGAPTERLRIANEGYWRSADGLIFAEHGHFVPGDVNAFRRFPAACTDAQGKLAPCTNIQGPVFLERPWGEQFVQDVYNRYEEQYPIIDNITSEAYGVKLAVAEAGPAAVADALARGFKFLLFHESPRQFDTLLGPRGDPSASKRTLGAGPADQGWDTAKVRAMDDRFLVESLDRGDPVRGAAELALAQGRLGVSLGGLTDAEIIELCNLRAARRESQIQARQVPTVELCPGATTLGALKTALLKSGAQRKSERLEAVRPLLPSDRPTRNFSLYVFAHTHSVQSACQPRQMAGRELKDQDGTIWNPSVVNTGAWQRLTTPERLAELREANKSKLLERYLPEELPGCYSMIVVNPYDAAKKEQPQGTVWFWARNRGSDGWDLHRSCPEDRWRLPKQPCAD